MRTVGVGGITTSGSSFHGVLRSCYGSPIRWRSSSATITVTANVYSRSTAPTRRSTRLRRRRPGFAPFYTNGAGSLAGNPPASRPSVDLQSVGPIPRALSTWLVADHADHQPVLLPAAALATCSSPWVVGDSTFTTSIVVANTSLDPGIAFGFVAAPPVRYCAPSGSSERAISASIRRASGPLPVTSTVDRTANHYGFGTPRIVRCVSWISPTTANATSQTAGNGLKPIAGNFAGYVIAQSQFQYCHGIASISAAGLNPQSYLGPGSRARPGTPRTISGPAAWLNTPDTTCLCRVPTRCVQRTSWRTQRSSSTAVSSDEREGLRPSLSYW